MPDFRLNRTWLRVAIYLSLVAITSLLFYAGILKFSSSIENLRRYGYGGIFLISLATTSTVIFPAPFSLVTFSLTAAVAAVTNPYLTVLIAGLGSALGEGVGYFLGFSGRKILSGALPYQKVRNWINRYGAWWVIVFLSAVPLVLFDIVGIVCGTLRYPFFKFLAFCFIGRTLRTFVTTFFLAEALQRFFD